MTASALPFDKVLVANRGEIACRVFRTCRELGLTTVAVYSDADGDAMHVREADEAVHIGPTRSSESYLRVEKIIEAAKSSGAGAIHPGYGFLSERPELVEACAAAGIIFIGPSAHAMNVMGDKVSARRAMLAAGVPVVPGRDDIEDAHAARARPTSPRRRLLASNPRAARRRLPMGPVAPRPPRRRSDGPS